MKKPIICIVLSILCILSFAQTANAEIELVPAGQVIGIELLDGSVTVAAFDETLGKNAQSAGLQVGDRITHIDDRSIESAADVRKALERADGTVDLRLERNGKPHQLSFQPMVTADGPKLGIYLKQGVTGVGTVTWYDPETGRFGALGHGVNSPKGGILNMSNGKVYPASVASVKRGQVGDPGQLCGTLDGSAPKGSLYKNTQQGIFGHCPVGWDGRVLPTASAEDVHVGPAVIRSTVSGNQVREYSVEILKIYPSERQTGRNLLLRVTDPDLLEATGGIVQGMSGSPIIQDGKLVGAVTHVLVNDPTTGYGIFIENMLDAAA